MERASAINMRKTLEAVEEFKRAGVMFIPMPVLNDRDGKELVAESERRLDILIAEAEKEEG